MFISFSLITYVLSSITDGPPGNPTIVYTHLHVLKIPEVNLFTSEMTVDVDIKMSWTDERLINQSSYDLSKLTVIYRPGSSNKLKPLTSTLSTQNAQTRLSTQQKRQYTISKIWLPTDVILYNPAEPMSYSLSDETIYIDNITGIVTYSRIGSIRPLCKFSGLQAFPYDRLGCQFQLGPWLQDDSKIQLQSSGIRYNIHEQEDTPFQEYSIFSLIVNEKPVTWNIWPGVKWSSLVYSIVLDRASIFYFYKLLLPSLALTFVTFSVFWISPLVGGIRTYICITALLSLIALDFIGGEFVPPTNQRLLVDDILFISKLFICLCIIQSTFVYYLFHLKSEYFPFYKWFINLYKYINRKLRNSSSVEKTYSDFLFKNRRPSISIDSVILDLKRARLKSLHSLKEKLKSNESSQEDSNYFTNDTPQVNGELDGDNLENLQGETSLTTDPLSPTIEPSFPNFDSSNTSIVDVNDIKIEGDVHSEESFIMDIPNEINTPISTKIKNDDRQQEENISSSNETPSPIVNRNTVISTSSICSSSINILTLSSLCDSSLEEIRRLERGQCYRCQYDLQNRVDQTSLITNRRIQQKDIFTIENGGVYFSNESPTLQSIKYKHHLICHHIKSFRRRVQIYQQLYYTIDTDYSNEIDLTELALFLDFVLGSTFSKVIRRELLRDAIFKKRNNTELSTPPPLFSFASLNGGQVVTRENITLAESDVTFNFNSFCALCETLFNLKDAENEEFFKKQAETFLTVFARQRNAWNGYWRHLSSKVDLYSRIWFPLVYIFVQLILVLVKVE